MDCMYRALENHSDGDVLYSALPWLTPLLVDTVISILFLGLVQGPAYQARCLSLVYEHIINLDVQGRMHS